MSNYLTILQGDAIAMLKTLPIESVQCVVTSPPYWGLRNYHVEGQIGREESFADYLAKLVTVFAEVRRVLRLDGTLWLNMGDCYAGSGKGLYGDGKARPAGKQATNAGSTEGSVGDYWLPSKNLVGQPWRLAFALQDAGWILRSDIVWAKPNPMPESVLDRPTRAHEYIFLLSKSPRYYYDADAIRNPPSDALLQQVQEGYHGSATKDFAAAGVQDASAVKTRIIDGMRKRVAKKRGAERPHQGFANKWDGMTRAEQMACGSNARDVWTIATKGYKGAHFATFPEDLPRRCILAGTRHGDVVLDPFGGSGTTAAVALGLGRRAVTIELNPEYVQLIRERCGLWGSKTAVRDEFGDAPQCGSGD